VSAAPAAAGSSSSSWMNVHLCLCDALEAHSGKLVLCGGFAQQVWQTRPRQSWSLLKLMHPAAQQGWRSKVMATRVFTQMRPFSTFSGLPRTARCALLCWNPASMPAMLALVWSSWSGAHQELMARMFWNSTCIRWNSMSCCVSIVNPRSLQHPSYWSV